MTQASGPSATDRDQLRARLIDHYGSAPVGTSGLSGRLYWKLFVWNALVKGTKAVKRLIDIVASAAGLALLMPLFAVVALAIRLESPGPIFFSQTRVGRWGELFRMYKFRSMYIDAEERKRSLMSRNEMDGGVLFKMKHDPRVTRVGRFIRKASIDELPQLWNVFVGDMSLVGPRPPVPSEVDQYSLSDRRRLDVVPGITCIWQVSGRSDIPFPEQVELDVQYIDSQSLLTDLKILLNTIPAVLLGKGAY
jgi:exopolysaccharide biosynthesis polyprenyl glycosylphosphotransferase